MAVRDGNQLPPIPGVDLADTRISAWLWLHLNNDGSRFGQDSFMAPGMYDLLACAVYSDPWLPSQIGGVLGRQLLPDECLTWIIDDDRQAAWLMSFFHDQFGFKIPFIPPRLFGRNLVVATIDIWDAGLSTKSGAVSRMEHAWNQYKQSDHIFSWFKEGDELSRCELAWAWFMEKRPFSTFGKAPISSYDDLLIFFDKLNFSDAEKKLEVVAIKKRWSQQQYRKNLKGKKQCNLLLSNQAMNNLDKLAARYEVSRSQVLEALIKFETKHASYLPEKVRPASSWEDEPDGASIS